MSAIRLRQLASREFYDPRPVLIALRLFERQLAETETPELLRRLRTGRLKTEREARAAAIFALGVGEIVSGDVTVSPGEFEDSDFVLCIAQPSGRLFTPVQLKELPPADLNSGASLDTLFSALSCLPQSDTVLAVHLNRREAIPIEELTRRRAPFRELWFFWATAPGSAAWCFFGDVMATPVATKVAYPR